MSAAPWPLIAAIASASLAFVYAQVSKRLEFANKRRSVAVAIAVEILEAKKSIQNLRLSWDNLRTIANSKSKSPIIIISSDIQVLNRTNLEELNYPPDVLIALTRFHNCVQEAYDFLLALNSDRFERMALKQRILIVNTSEAICEESAVRADKAIDSLIHNLPEKWFKGIESNATTPS